MKKHWYKQLFENYARSYQDEPYVKGTMQEVDFIEKEIGFDKGLKILDVGCGTGRHSIELARRGYSVTGIDLSENMLSLAKEHAKKSNLKDIEFICMDAVKLELNKQFDVAIMICEGAFPLMETDDKNFQILKNINSHLNSNGKLIMTTLNSLFIFTHGIREGEYLDLLTSRLYGPLEYTDDDGVDRDLKFNERYYSPSEMNWLLRQADFENVEIFGCIPGNFSRENKVSFESFELLILAEKKKA